jgi:thiol-disulfide isomerase/thioredoxin
MQHTTSRRQWIVGSSAACIASGLGIATALWQNQQTDKAPPLNAIWNTTFSLPEGQSIQLKHWQGQRLLLNFWATWCPPCLQELPLLNEWANQRATHKTQVIGIAIDQPQAVQRHLNAHPLSFPILTGASEGMAMGKMLGNATGSLPFSVLLSAAGHIAFQKMGVLHASDLTAWAQP